jgi:hypothetical protein
MQQFTVGAEKMQQYRPGAFNVEHLAVYHSLAAPNWNRFRRKKIGDIDPGCADEGLE